jgi:hypothetical protein
MGASGWSAIVSSECERSSPLRVVDKQSSED